MTGQRLIWPDVDDQEVAEGWTPMAELPEGSKVTANEVLSALALRHDEGGWNGMPGRWVFLREVSAQTGQWGEQQRFDAVALGLVPSVGYARIVYEVKVSRSDWLRELKPQIRFSYRGHGLSGTVAAHHLKDDGIEQLRRAGYTEERRDKWAAAMAVATEFWYAAPPKTILPSELPDGAGLVEIRPWRGVVAPFEPSHAEGPSRPGGEVGEGLDQSRRTPQGGAAEAHTGDVRHDP